MTLQSPPLTAQDAFDKMIAVYRDAKSIKGTITFSQTAYSQSTLDTIEARMQVKTVVQREQPNLFFLEQKRDPFNEANLNYFSAVCDGKKMSYTMDKRLLPFVGSKPGESIPLYENAPKSAAEGLDAFCTLLAERSLPVALAMGNSYEVKRAVRPLSNFRLDPSGEKLSGEKTYRILAAFDVNAGWRGAMSVKIPAVIVIGDDFNLRSLSTTESMMPGGTSRVQSIKTEWVVDLVLNPTSLDASKYKVR